MPENAQDNSKHKEFVVHTPAKSKEDKSEKSFRDSEKKYRSLFENMLDGFAFCRMIFDKHNNPVDFVYLEINDAFERLTGLKREAVIGKRVTEAIPGIEKANPELFESYGRVALTCEEEKFEIFFKPLSKWFSISAYCPQKGHFAAVFEDITERKKGEQELWKAKSDWELTFDSVPDFIAILDNQFRIVRANRAMTQQLYVTPEQAIRLFCYQCVHGLDHPPDFCPHAQTVKDGKEHQAEVHEPRLGGDFLVTTTPLKDEQGRMVGSVHVARNITERKQREREIENIAKFPSENPNPVFRVNEKGTILYCNPVGASLLTAWNSKVGRRAPEYISQSVAKALASNRRIEIEEKYGHKMFSLLFAPVTFEGYVNIYATDITERKKMEQEVSDSLEESRRRESEISALLKASKAVLQNKEFSDSARAIFNAAKELIGATAGYVALLSDNGKENEVLFLDSGGLPCTVNPSLPMPIRGLRAEAYNSGEVAVENVFENSEWKKFMPDGHVRLKNVLFAPLTIEHRAVGVIGLANKIGGFTNRDAEMAKAFGELASVALVNSKMLEMLEENEKELKMHSEHLEELVEERTKELKDAERLAAIGATAGMVGHDIRNPLQAITGDVYLAKIELDTIPESNEKSSALECLQEIEKNVEYINKIVADLQDFARPLRPNAEETDLKLVVYELLHKNGLPENVKVSVKVETEKVVADSTFINRIMYNLVNNAVQAMPKGGELTIHAYKESNDTVITVKDTGIGIPEAVKRKLFTPMFTTKSKGQGFGLPVVKRMTESLGGTVSFESQEGKGTTFIVRLPASQRDKR